MAHKRRSTPHHFFKPLIPGFLSNFCIPKSFLKHLGLEESTDENDFIAVLKSPSWCAGNGEDKSWLVQVDVDGRHFLDGWKEFAEDHLLRIGYFILFNHLGDFVFEVTVFDPVSACPRSFSAETSGCVKSKQKTSTPPKKAGDVKSKGKKSTPMKRFTFKPSKNRYFRTIVKPYSFAFRGMVIPIKFARASGLLGRWCGMTVVDQKDEAWPVTLKSRTYGNGRVESYLATGWKDLAEAHGLKAGDSVVYELIDCGSHPVMKFYKES